MELIAGIVIGSAFAPFWMMLYEKAKPIFLNWFKKLK